ncbi:MAG: nitrate reductase cytochrome c-type subunit [Candidatus Omnitrophica bacterium]|nr:nitrate reductase cytochrome c-type subunit [Candidatus Omnitrophota bacterium]
MMFFVNNILMASDKTVIDKIIEKEKIVEQDKRAILRAFYSAPPVIPHDVDEPRDAKDCLRCHLNVTKLDDGRVGMQTPHPQFSNCLQCHVPGYADGGKKLPTSWEGLEEPKRGDRWFIMSPPTVPHRIRMRENCLSCHGPENPDMRLRTSHPERSNCLQCHVPQYGNDF